MGIEKPPIATHFGWVCKYTPTVMDGPVIRWGHEQRYGRGEINAGREVVTCCGTVNITDNVMKLFVLAEQVRKKLSLLGSGSIDPIIEFLKTRGDKPQKDVPNGGRT